MQTLAVSRGQAASNLEMIGLILHTPEGSIETIPPDRFSVVDSQEGPIPEQIRGTCDVASYVERPPRLLF